MLFLKTLLLYLSFVFYMIGSIFKKIKYIHLKKKSKEKAQEYLNNKVVNWANYIVKYVGLTVNIEGLENIPKGSFLLVSNHQSNLDMPVILSSLNMSFAAIAKKEMEKIPIVSYWMKEINCIFMDRNNIRESVKSINQGIQFLKSGKPILVFPEGTRSKSSNVGEFKKGSMKLGTKANVPIVPISINGTYKALEGNNNRFKPADVKLIIHKPIIPSELSKEEQNGLAEEIRGIILKDM